MQRTRRLVVVETEARHANGAGNLELSVLAESKPVRLLPSWLASIICNYFNRETERCSWRNRVPVQQPGNSGSRFKTRARFLAWCSKMQHAPGNISAESFRASGTQTASTEFAPASGETRGSHRVEAHY